MNIGLMVLIGLPGSGKTTLAKSLINNSGQLVERKYYFIHICYDELIPFSNEGSILDWKKARNSILSDIEKLVISIKSKNKDLCPEPFTRQFEKITYINTNIVLMIDDNMYFKSMRYTIYQIAKKYNLGFSQVYLNCSLDMAVMKNKERSPSSVVPNEIIINMHNKLEPPNKVNNWEKHSLIADAFCNVDQLYNQLFPMLNDSLLNVEYTTAVDSKERELSVIQCNKNVIHQVDLTLRKLVGKKTSEILSDGLTQEKKELISQLNVRRSEILVDIKAGNISLTKEILQEIEEIKEDKCILYEFLSNYF